MVTWKRGFTVRFIGRDGVPVRSVVLLVALRVLKLHYLFDFWLWFARISFDLIRGDL